MTCISGLVDDKGKVWIGGDSAGVSGLDLAVRSDAMARLKTIKPTLSRIPQAITALTHRYSAAAGGDWSKLYNLRAWRGKPNGLRWQTLLRDGFTCQMCKAIITDTSKAHVDHIEPHRGDIRLFLDPDNVQTLCERCHNSEKQSQERGGPGLRRVGLDGYPID